MIITVYLILFLFGSIAGSFFYTLALRYADGSISESPLKALFSRSRCPSCGKPVKYILLIPLAGYILAGRKCSNCGNRISALYPLTEIFFGALLAVMTARLGLSAHTVYLYLVVCVASVISIVDIKTMTIPDTLVIIFALLSVYAVYESPVKMHSLYGGALMAVFFITLLLMFPGSFGMGDLKYSIPIGVFAGIEQAVVILETALISGAIFGLIYALKSGKGLRSKIAFGPFLSFGVFMSIMYGQDIALIYYRFID